MRKLAVLVLVPVLLFSGRIGSTLSSDPTYVPIAPSEFLHEIPKTSTNSQKFRQLMLRALHERLYACAFKYLKKLVETHPNDPYVLSWLALFAQYGFGNNQLSFEDIYSINFPPGESDKSRSLPLFFNFNKKSLTASELADEKWEVNQKVSLLLAHALHVAPNNPFALAVYGYQNLGSNLENVPLTREDLKHPKVVESKFPYQCCLKAIPLAQDDPLVLTLLANAFIENPIRVKITHYDPPHPIDSGVYFFDDPKLYGLWHDYAYRYDLAYQCLLRALKVDPNFVDAHLTMAYLTGRVAGGWSTKLQIRQQMCRWGDRDYFDHMYLEEKKRLELLYPKWRLIWASLPFVKF